MIGSPRAVRATLVVLEKCPSDVFIVMVKQMHISPLFRIDLLVLEHITAVK